MIYIFICNIAWRIHQVSISISFKNNISNRNLWLYVKYYFYILDTDQLQKKY
jgi:hypothetical protein